jgi:hypothetical protein
LYSMITVAGCRNAFLCSVHRPADRESRPPTW